MVKNRITKLVEVSPKELIANPLNARKHPEKQRAALRESIDRIGWVAPIIVNEVSGLIVDGHARLDEALLQGMQKVPVLIVSLNEEEEAAMLASYDAIGELANWDSASLELLVQRAGDMALQNLIDAPSAPVDFPKALERVDPVDLVWYAIAVPIGVAHEVERKLDGIENMDGVLLRKSVQ